MSDTPRTPKRPDAPATREDRLKAALKSNMAKRKAQARARAEDPHARGSSDDTPRDADG